MIIHSSLSPILLGMMLFLVTSQLKAEDQYIFKESKLSEGQKEKYLQVKSHLDSWVGKEESLVKARQLIGELEKEEPNFFPVKIEKARLIMMQGAQDKKAVYVFYSDAREYLEKIQQLAPYYAPTYSLLGHVYTFLDELELAKESLDKSHSLGFRGAWLYLNYATYYTKVEEHEKVLSNAIHALSRPGLTEKASTAAVGLILEGAKYTGNRLDVGYLQLLIYRNIDTSERVISLASNIIYRHPRNRQLMQLSFNLLERELGKNRKDNRAKFMLAEWYFSNKIRYPEGYCSKRPKWIEEAAEPLYEELSKLEDYKLMAFERLIYFELAKQNRTAAFQMIEEFGKYPKYDKTHALLLSQYYYCNQNYSKAIELIEKSSKKYPEQLKQKIYADAYSSLGDHSFLDKYFNESLELDPDNAYLNGNYARFLSFKLRNFEKATDYFKVAMSIKPYRQLKTNFSITLLMAMSQEYKTNNFEKAQSYYDEMLYYGLRTYIEKNNCFSGCEKYIRIFEKLDEKHNSFSFQSRKMYDSFSKFNMAEKLLAWYATFLTVFLLYMIFNSFSFKPNFMLFVITMLLSLLGIFAIKEVSQRFVGLNDYIYFAFGLAPILGAVLGRVALVSFGAMKSGKKVPPNEIN
ncbi:MAG: hypothetical protein OQK51_09800 [Kangiellaceae bacterium]|nr:hypothetical protein [Kangiellaceae bacterium]